VIASRDRSLASRLLAESPLLARQAIEVGATRETANAYYFEEIAHYAYAGDTPLHVAAAAYQSGIAEELASRGANVSARNRRGAEPLHYAADGAPGSPAWDPDAQYAIVESALFGRELATRSRGGARHLLGTPLVRDLAGDGRLVALAAEVLGTSPTPFRATLIDKSAGANCVIMDGRR
jgi:hypothetical protein